MRLRKQQRLALVVLALLLVGGATGLVLAALDDKVAFFVTPTDLASTARAPASGSGSAGWWSRAASGARPTAPSGSPSPTRRKQVQVTYKGLLPDLFRDGQGVVTQGVLRAGRRASRRARCWPSTTRTTCPRKSPTR